MLRSVSDPTVWRAVQFGLFPILQFGATYLCSVPVKKKKNGSPFLLLVRMGGKKQTTDQSQNAMGAKGWKDGGLFL